MSDASRPQGDHRLDLLIFLLVIGALVGIWGAAIGYTAAERTGTLERVRTQLGFTVAALADANVLAENADGKKENQRSEIRTETIWKALLQFPTASIWVESRGKILAGQSAPENADSYIVAAERRETESGGFTVHGALPAADALQHWHRTAWLQFGTLSVASIAFLITTQFLAKALRLRAHAEQQTAAAMQNLLLRDRALESISQGVTVTDDKAPGNPIIYTNPAFAELTRYGRDEVLGHGPLSFFGPDVAARVEARLNQARKDQRPWRMECLLKRKDGTFFLDSMTTTMIVGADGSVSHSVTAHEDVTELRKREMLLLEAQKMDSVGQLTGGIAHDFNNLLTAILINTEKMREKFKQTPDVARHADIIIRAADRGAGLIHQLLAFARKQELDPKTIDANELIVSFSDLLRRALPAHIALDIRKADWLPLTKVDPGRLESAILNLALNSRDAMPDGGTLTIETEARKIAEQDGIGSAEISEGLHVVLTVTDTGTGMSREVLERAFEPFFTTKEIDKGTGLGLSMVYGFVKQSGGHIEIKSEPAQGTSVRIFLPAEVAEVPTTPDDSASAETVNASPGRILLVEDDELLRMTIGEQLTMLGYSVVVAATAAEAIDTIEQTPQIDLVFSDVVMPGGMNGVELAREVQHRWPQIKLLLTSGYAEDHALKQIRLLSDVKLLAKPYKTAVLAQIISETLSAPPAESRQT